MIVQEDTRKHKSERDQVKGEDGIKELLGGKETMEFDDFMKIMQSTQEEKK